MLLNTRKSRISCIFSMAAFALASCAANSSPQTEAVTNNPSPGKMLTGKVAAIRNVNITGGASSAFQDVLNALHQNQMPRTVSGTEYVIQLNDGNAITMSESSGSGGYKNGDHVAVIETGPTGFLQQN